MSRRGERLSTDVTPSDYALSLVVRPGADRAYRGEVRIEVELARPTRVVELHAAELDIRQVGGEREGVPLAATVETFPERERIALRFPRRLPAGPLTLTLRFRGRLREDLRGLYRVRADGRSYAFTQLEAADARRFFPCFDEPSHKARFTLTVETDAANQVLSNSPIAATQRRGDRNIVRFRPTPRLSTYLLALAVGPLVASPRVRKGNTPIRVWHVPDKGGLHRFALETARECLSRLESYFALPYPYEKLDLVAVPDFEAGAMENAGAVFFRETLLLLDPATATAAERKRAAEVICHELAHMWYGDLVTMAWWDDLWLNEAFATWMAFEIVDAWRPEWRMWNDFQVHRAAALAMDALHHTHPIHTPVRNPEEASANFDLITYEKGAAVVRMLERYLGSRTFRAGVRRYIRRHRESNATASDLWRALSEAADEDVESLVRPWIERAGFPVLQLEREGPGAEITASQRRFRTAPAKSTGRRGTADDAGEEPWPLPWVGHIGTRPRSRLLRQRLEARRDRIEVPSPVRFVYGNAQEGAFFRPLHGETLFAELLAQRATLHPVERMGWIDHEWALAQGAHTDLDRFLRLLDAERDERHPDVLRALRGPLAFLEDRLAAQLGESTQTAFRERIVALFSPALREIGWGGGRRRGTELVRERRAELVGILGGIGAWSPLDVEAEEAFERYLEAPASLDSYLVDGVVELAARRGGVDRYARLRSAAREAMIPQQQRRFLFALASFREPALIGRTQRLCLGSSVPTQDTVFILIRLLANPAARASTWDFIKAHWEPLRRRMPPLLAGRLVEATPLLGGAAYARDVAAFFREHPLPAARRSTRQALERFRREATFCRLSRAPLRRWLRASAAS